MELGRQKLHARGGCPTANESNSFFVPETPMGPKAGKSAAATGAACDSYEMPTPFRTPMQTASTPRRLAAAASSTPSCASFKVPESPLVLESSTDVSTGADSSASFIAPRCGRIKSYFCLFVSYLSVCRGQIKMTLIGVPFSFE